MSCLYRILGFHFIALLVLSHSAAFAQNQEDDEKSKFTMSNSYVHEWLIFPTIEGENIFGDRTIHLKPRFGRSIVLIFLSSWCIPCQNLMPDFIELYKKHSQLFSDVIFVFSNDTQKDAQGFAKEYKLSAPAIMATDEILQQFNMPESPSIYIGDRWGWMTKKMTSTTREDIVKADHFLSLLARQ